MLRSELPFLGGFEPKQTEVYMFYVMIAVDIPKNMSGFAEKVFRGHCVRVKCMKNIFGI